MRGGDVGREGLDAGRGQLAVFLTQSFGRAGDRLDNPCNVRATDSDFTAIPRNGVDARRFRFEELAFHERLSLATGTG